MSYPQKATDEQVVRAYRLHGSVWKAARELGMCGQSVHERLVRLGIDTSRNLFTSEDAEYLASRYVIYRDAGKLQDLADEMGRTKPFICRKAGAMGLTDPHRKAPWSYKWEEISVPIAKPIWDKFKRSKLTLHEFCEEKHYSIQHFVDAMNRCFPEEYDAVIEGKSEEGTRRRRGMDFEFEVRDDLKHHGYLAMRSPASKSPADVYAFKFGEAVFVQCRVGGGFPPSEWNSFIDYCTSVNSLPILAQSNAGGGIEYWLLMGRKEPGDNHLQQPKVPWRPSDEARSSTEANQLQLDLAE